jgi:undecaprenyl-diphosphatase
MNGLEAALLGSIQGLVEWLPLSSKAQTMLYMINVLRIEPRMALSYAIFLHLGTMFAAIITFRREYLGILRNLNIRYPLTRILLLATACTAVIAVPLYFLLKAFLIASGGTLASLLIGLMLLVTGITLKISANSGVRVFDQIRDRDILVLGFAQGFAMIPGISRSGITVATLLAERIEQETALRISFLISVPAIIGVLVIDSPSIIAIPLETAIVLTVSAFLVGYLSMNALLKFSGRLPFWVFCLGLGAITIAYSVLILS